MSEPVDWKRTFVSAWVAQVLSIVGFAFTLPFLPFFVAELGITEQAEQAWWSGVVLGATGLTLGFFAPIWGVLADRYGRRVMVMRAMFGGTLVLLLMSFVQTIGQLVVCRLLQGALTGTVGASIALVASVSPAKRSGFTLGMMQAAVFIGVCVGPLFGGIVSDHMGYRPAFRMGAVLVLLGGLLVRFGTREDAEPAAAEEDAPQSFRSLLMTGGFLTAVVVLFLVRFSNTMSNPSFPLIVKEIVPGSARLNSVTGSVLAAAAFAGAVSAAVLGLVGDRWGHWRVLIACSLSAAAASVAHVFVHSIPALIAARVGFGISVAGMLPAANAMIRSVSHERHIGKAYGAATALSMVGLALGPLVGGYLAKTAGLRMPFLATGVGQLLLGSGVLVFLHRRSAR